MKNMPILSPIQSDERGFTLVEIAIVGAILSLAAAVSVPNFLQMYAKHELYQATTSLYNRLILARSSAISRNAMFTTTPSSVPMGLDLVVVTNVTTASNVTVASVELHSPRLEYESQSVGANNPIAKHTRSKFDLFDFADAVREGDLVSASHQPMSCQ